MAKTIAILARKKDGGLFGLVSGWVRTKGNYFVSLNPTELNEIPLVMAEGDLPNLEQKLAGYSGKIVLVGGKGMAFQKLKALSPEIITLSDIARLGFVDRLDRWTKNSG